MELPGNTAEEPILVEFNMNEEWTAGSATITVEPGVWYYGAYISGMILTANGESVEVTVTNPRMPAIFCFTNEGTEAVTYELAVSYPVGSMSNPAALVLGENAAAIEAGNDQGYYFTWTAPAKGVLSVTMPQGNWIYVLNNMSTGSYGDTQWSDSEPVVNPGTIQVNAGDRVQVMVNTYDPANPWTTPAGTVAFQADFQAAQVRPLELVPMVGEPAVVEQQADGSYVVYLDKEDVAKETILFSVMANAADENGNPIELGVKDLKWSTSDSRVATVKNGIVTVKTKIDGACVITAVNTKTKDEAIVTIHVRDYAPRLGDASLSLNTNAVAGVETTLLPSYGNAIEAVSLHEYDSKAKAYLEEESARLVAEYAEGKLTITHGEAMKNGTYKLLLKAVCANGEAYEYPISLKAANKLPSVTVKQLGKFNTFYTDSEARFQVTAKDAVIRDVAFETASFVGEYDAETGILTVRYSEEYLENGGKAVTKGNFEVSFEGYFVPVKKAVTVSTEKKAPKLALYEKSSVVNTALSGAPITAFFAYYSETEQIVAAEHIRVEAGFATGEVTEDGLVIVTLSGKKGGTVNVYVQEENWIEPVKLTHKITVQTKLPALKLSSSTVKLNTVFPDQYAVQYLYLDQINMVIGDLWLEPTSKKEAVLQEMSKLLVEVYSDGIVLAVDPDNLPKKGTYEIKVTAFVYNNTDPENLTKLSPKTFKVVVEDKVPTIKLKASTLKLNKVLGTEAYGQTAVTMTGAPEGYQLVDLLPAEENQNFQVHYDQQSGKLDVKLLNDQLKNGSYTIKLQPVVQNMWAESAEDTITLEKAVTLKVQVYEGKPAVTVKASGKLDTIVPGSSITYTISKLTNIAGEPAGVRLEGTGSELFNIELNEEGNAVVTLKAGQEYQKDKSYKLQLVYTIAGQEVAANVTLKVTQSAVKFASVKALNLYQSNSRLAVVLEMTAPAGASIDSVSLGTKTAKQFRNALGEEGVTFVELEDGKVLVSFRIENPAYLSYGKSYTVYLDIAPEGSAANAKPTSVKLTVKTQK